MGGSLHIPLALSPWGCLAAAAGTATFLLQLCVSDLCTYASLSHCEAVTVGRSPGGCSPGGGVLKGCHQWWSSWGCLEGRPSARVAESAARPRLPEAIDDGRGVHVQLSGAQGIGCRRL